MRLLLNIKNQSIIEIQLIKNKHIIDVAHLTISRNLDTLLIRAIDKVLSRNRIDRLSLIILEIPTKLKDEAVSNMIIRTTKAGLEV